LVLELASLVLPKALMLRRLLLIKLLECSRLSISRLGRILSPYRDIGAQASGDLSKRLSDLTSPITVDPNQLENSDYYKFASTQGQKAVTNSAAARGLASFWSSFKRCSSFR
jgi:hypothetical protein